MKKMIIILVSVIVLLMTFTVSVSASEWQSDTDIVGGLGDIGASSAPCVFTMNGTQYLITGSGLFQGELYGYNWTGTTWQSDSVIVSGTSTLEDYEFTHPTVFYMDGIWYMIVGTRYNIILGFNWTGSTWQSDDAIVSGLSLPYDKHIAPSVFSMGETRYLILGTYGGSIHGYNWTGSTWQVDAAIRSGLQVAGDASFAIFNMDGTQYAIEYAYSVWGYNWTGTTWQNDAVIINGDLGESYYAPCVFQGDKNKTWYQIVGCGDGAFTGYEWIPYISNVTSDVSVTDQVSITWNVNINTNNTVEYDINESLGLWSSWSSWDNNTMTPSILLTELEQDTKYYYRVWSYDSNDTNVNATSLTYNFTTSLGITNLANTTGNFWISWTWTNPDVETFDYNKIYIDDALVQDSAAGFYNATYVPHATRTIKVYSVYTNGDTSSTYATQTTTIPNNPVTILGVIDYSMLESEVVFVDIDATNIDSDTLYFTCNRTDLFVDFNYLTGIGNWKTTTASGGTYYVNFTVSDGYTSMDSAVSTIVIIDTTPSVEVPVNVTVTSINTNDKEIVIFKDYVFEPTISIPDNHSVVSYGWSITDENEVSLAVTVNQTNGYATFKPLTNGTHTATLSVLAAYDKYGETGEYTFTSTIQFVPLTQSVDIRLIWSEAEEMEEEISVPLGSERTAYLIITNIGTDDYFDITVNHWIEQNDKRMGKLSTTDGGLSLQHKIPIAINTQRTWNQGTYILMMTITTDNGKVYGVSKQLEVTSPIRTAEEIDTARQAIMKKMGIGMFVSIIVASVGYVYIKQSEKPTDVFKIAMWKKML
ncbi:MAG: hypothetical protein KAY32_16005, partial [Candidatus Eisenbacteria sp.]|nr:hypothetical protein [Candidatus Eisenbacteria bacterium]